MQNNTKKHKTNTDIPRQKFAPENVCQTATLKKNGKKKGKRHPTRHKKHKMKKTDSISPFKQGDNLTLGPDIVTVRLP